MCFNEPSRGASEDHPTWPLRVLTLLTPTVLAELRAVGGPRQRHPLRPRREAERSGRR